MSITSIRKITPSSSRVVEILWVFLWVISWILQFRLIRPPDFPRKIIYPTLHLLPPLYTFLPRHNLMLRQIYVPLSTRDSVGTGNGVSF